MSRRSTCTLVLPSPPGATPERLKTLVPKPASAATSKLYVSGRTPLVVEFWTTSRMGWSLSLNLNPCAGASRAGAVMLTPGIGPATVGEVGWELFAVSQPTNPNTARAQAKRAKRDVMANLEVNLMEQRQGAPMTRAFGLSALTELNFREKR